MAGTFKLVYVMIFFISLCHVAGNFEGKLFLYF